MEILALVGLAAVLWLLARAATNVGNVFVRVGDWLATRDAGKVRTTPAVPEDKEERIRAAKGEGTDSEYQDRVRKEIEEITGE